MRRPPAFWPIRGATVVLAARREDDIAAHAGAIRAAGGKASHMRTDVADAGDVEAMVARTVATYGRLDIARQQCRDRRDGGAHRRYGRRRLGCRDRHQPARQFPVPQTSGAGDVGSGQWRCHRQCRIGQFLPRLRGLCALLRFEKRADRADLICLCRACAAGHPGQSGLSRGSSTPRSTGAHGRKFGDAVYDELIERRIHLKRAGQPDEIARAIAFLASDEASFITGTTLTADGGFHLTL